MKASDFKPGEKVVTSRGIKGVVHPLHAKMSTGVRVTVETENGSVGTFPVWELTKIEAE